VGSARRPILAETDDYIFVAPDNGVLSLIESREPKFSVRHITSDRYFLQPLSQTFHGRDIFSPVAAWLSKGVAPAEFGPEISEYVRLPLPAVGRVTENSLRGVVLKVDKFGNLITNFSEQEVPALFAAIAPRVRLLIAGREITRLCRSYEEGGDEEFFAIIGSSGYVEVAARQESAAKKLSAGVGTPVGVLLEE
jgi:S-adenosylmethionine hydrolase